MATKGKKRVEHNDPTTWVEVSWRLVLKYLQGRPRTVILTLILILIGTLAIQYRLGKLHGLFSFSGSSKLKVAAVFQTDIKESWDGAIHSALQQMESERLIEYEHTDGAKDDKFTTQLETYAAQGYDIIFGDAFGAELEARRIAEEHAKTAFVFGSALGPTRPNFSVFLTTGFTNRHTWLGWLQPVSRMRTV
ncbi:hypothetical protein ACFL5F_07020 [Planctomycetota bacterium]